MPIADEALIAKLRAIAKDDSASDYDIERDCGLAADRIAALTAEVESLRAQMLKAITYIQMNGADQELTIVINCAYRAGLTQAAIDHALAQGTEQGLT